MLNYAGSNAAVPYLKNNAKNPNALRFLFQSEGNSEGQRPPVMLPPSDPSGAAQLSAIEPNSLASPNADDSGGRTRIILSVLAIFILAAVVYSIYSYTVKSPPARTVAPPAKPKSDILSCESITSPGIYNVDAELSSQPSGSCLIITSGNVKINGNGNKVVGDGPFVQTPPFSYGVEIDGVSNVTVTGLNVSRFSYDIFLMNATASTVVNNIALNGTISGVYLYGSSNNIITNNKAFGAGSQRGGLGMQGGGNNTVSHNRIMYNAYYGAYLNSTGNKFLENNISSNPVDLFCSPQASLRQSNSYLGSACSTNYYCNFAYCSKTNLPSNLSFEVLSKNIKSCGVINAPGDYQLISNLNLSNYVNTSNPLSNNVCLKINSPNVNLNCRNNTIYNSYYGVFSSNYNTIINNCNFYNNTYAVYLNNAFDSGIHKGSATHSKYGAYLFNVSSSSVFGTTYAEDTYGIYLNNTSSVVINSTSASNNTYGVYYASGQTNAFLGSVFSGNSKEDFFCSSATYNSSFNIMQSNSCGLTDCSWGTCERKVLPPVKTYPVFGCSTLSVPGNYTLDSGIIQTHGSGCISITGNSISLNCNSKLIEGDGLGSGISVRNSSYDTLTGCNLNTYPTGINASNTAYLTINKVNVSASKVGISVENSNESSVMNSTVTTFTDSGFLFSGVNYGTVSNDRASQGVSNATGFTFTGSNHNIIKGNFANSNPGYGILLSGSRENLISNNTAESNLNYDYQCAGSSSGIYAESGGVNTGITKNSCFWLVEQNPLATPSCYLVSHSTDITLQSDMLYTYGTTCYSFITTNSSSGAQSTLDCRGHTIVSTKGGTFANVKAPYVTIENCNLVGFSRAVVSSSSYTDLVNDTIINSNYSVEFDNATYPSVSLSFFTNSTYGIYGQDSKYGSIEKNTFINVSNGIELFGGSAFQILNNVVNTATSGLSLFNSQLNILQSNSFLNTTSYGIECTQFASNLSNNFDHGENVCSTNNGCLWMSSSTGCLPK